MKEFIYWPLHLNQSAPQLFGVLSSTAAPLQWVALPDVALHVANGEAVQIRPASASEVKRAESLIALWEIGAKLGEHIENLLDQHGQEAVIEAKLGLHDAFVSQPSRPGQFNDPAILLDVSPSAAHG